MQKRVVSLSLALVLALPVVGGLTGCATGNTSIANENVDTLSAKLVPGKTSKEDVRKEFGEPMEKAVAGGKETWTYRMLDSSARTYIPFVGLIVGDNGHESIDLEVVFDRKGRVERHEFTKTKG